MFDSEKINKIIKNTEIGNGFALSQGKDGGMVLKAFFGGCSFFINSKYNSENEAIDFAKEYYTPDKDLFVYGLGMGFHIKALADMLSPKQRMYVIELNCELLKAAFENTDISDTLKKDNIIFDVPTEFNEGVLRIKDYFNKNTSFICHEPSLRVMPEEFGEIKELFETYILKRRSFSILGTLLSDNEKINLTKNYENGGKVFKDRFKGKRAVVVSAGPSLELNGEKIKYLKYATVICVGRAFKYLKKIGVKPDFIIVTEAKEEVILQLDMEETEIPLFFLSTSCVGLEKYKGKKYILFEKYSDKVMPKEKQFTVETGGSVATTALSLAYIMGFSEIILIGQDLCYHSDKMHAGEGEGYISVKTRKKVTGIDGNIYYSPQNLYEYLKWFRKFAAKHTDVKLINCTAKGAFIDGFEHRNIEDFIKGGRL